MYTLVIRLSVYNVTTSNISDNNSSLAKLLVFNEFYYKDK